MAFLNEVGLAYFKSKLDTEVGVTELVHNKGTLVTVSQLPASPAPGDFYFIESEEAFYVYIGGSWRTVGCLRQADTVGQLPDSPAELAVLVSSLEDGAHLTILN